MSCNQDTAHLLSTNNKQVQEFVEALTHVVENGINLLGTAPWYGHGSRETIIGLASRHRNVDIRQIIINAKIVRYDSERLNQFHFAYDMTIIWLQAAITRRMAL